MGEGIWAVRGAITIPEDTPEEIITATKELLNEVLKANQIEPEKIISIIFTVTSDISSEFPAVAARQLGLGSTPLMCALEIPKPGSLPLCIRLLMHFYTTLSKFEIKGVYLRDAVKLRPDLISEQ
jgi:chorismate mutase